MGFLATAKAKLVEPMKEFIREIEKASRPAPKRRDPWLNDHERRRQVNERAREAREGAAWIPRRPGWLDGRPRERW